MAELTHDAPLRFLGEAKSERFYLDTSAAKQVWKGAGVIIDQSEDTTHVRTANAVVAVDGDVFVGIAVEAKYVKAGDPETTELEVYTYPSIVGFKSTVFTDADLGKVVYMSDTGTLSDTNGAYPQIGSLYKVEDGYAYVSLDTPFVLDVP